RAVSERPSRSASERHPAAWRSSHLRIETSPWGPPATGAARRSALMAGSSRRSKAATADVMPPTRTKATATSGRGVRAASHLHPRQAPDDQEADGFEGEPGAQEHRRRRRLDQWIEVSRRQEVEDDREQHRAEPDENGGVPLLGGQHTGVAQQLESLADDVAQT